MRRKEHYPKRTMKRLLAFGAVGALGLGLAFVVSHQSAEQNNPVDEVLAIETSKTDSQVSQETTESAVSQEPVDLDKGLLAMKWTSKLHPFGTTLTTDNSTLEVTVGSPTSENVDEKNTLWAVFPVTIKNVSNKEINRQKNREAGFVDLWGQDVYSQYSNNTIGSVKVTKPIEETIRLMPGESVETEIEFAVNLQDKDPYKHEPFVISDNDLNGYWLYQPFEEKSEFAWSEPGTVYQAGDVSVTLNHYGYSTDEKTGDFDGSYCFDFTITNNSNENIETGAIIDGYPFGGTTYNERVMTDPNEDSTHMTIYPGESANVTLKMEPFGDEKTEPILVRVSYPDGTRQLYGFGNENLHPYRQQ